MTKQKHMNFLRLSGPWEGWLCGCPEILGRLVQWLSCPNHGFRATESMGWEGPILGIMDFSVVASLTLGRSGDVGTVCVCPQ